MGRGMCGITDGWAEVECKLETDGPRDVLHERRMGRGTVYSGDGWAEGCVALQTDGPT